MELTLVGTGHVLDIADLVDRIIEQRRPDVVCVELDNGRLRGLLERRQLAELEAQGDPRAAQIRARHDDARKRAPLAYRWLARIQERLADGQGVEAGTDMLAAVDTARRHGIAAACIDVEAEALIRRAWREMRFGERVRFAWALARGGPGRSMEEELTDYESDPVAYLAQVGKDFPALKRVLIDERDEHMAQRLLELPRHADRLPSRPTVVRAVAVVGDGHVEGITTRLKATLRDEQLEVIRVADLRAQRIPASPFADRGAAGDGTHASVSYEVDAPAYPE